MRQNKKHLSGRMPWLAGTAIAALAAAGLRCWQLHSAFEPDTGFIIPGSQASVILVCAAVMAAAWFVILSIYQPVCPKPPEGEEDHRWDVIFLDAGDRVYPMLEVAAAFLAILAVPVLFVVGMGQFRLYQDLLAAQLQIPSNNGLLTLAAAAGAFLAAIGLLQTAREGLRPGRPDKARLAAALPGVAGCIWLMETFRTHAANPVLWDYAPHLLAIVLGMEFYLDFAGMSVGAAHPRRLLWMAAMTVVVSAAALASTAAEVFALAGQGGSLCTAQLGDLCLLLSQLLAAAGVLWRLPPNLEHPPERPEAGPDPIQEIQEETRDE